MTMSNSGQQVGSSGWLADLQQRTTKLQEDIGNAVVTLSSSDQSVTVTVGPNGALHNLQLGHRAAGHSPTRLTALIMDTVRTAQRRAAERVSEAFVPFGNAALAEQTKKFITYDPPEDEPGPAADTEPDPDKFVPADLTEQQAQRPEPPRPAPQQPPGRPVRRPAADDSDDNLEPW
jgi:DNA-binding protein YbaB